MEELYKYTKLSRDIINIINKYLDYSDVNIQRLVNKCKTNISLKFKDITLLDALLIAVKRGFSGFYYKITESTHNITNRFKKEKTDKIEISEGGGFIKFKFSKENTSTIHIDNLEIFNYVFD
jgi:hypothetical protein